jgi:outer membrane lipoprotein-sorting protein
LQAKEASGGIFLVFRLPLLILLLLGFLFGLSFGGWYFYHHYRNADPAEKIRQRMQDHIASLESYHARFKTIPLGQANELTYSVEIWKELPDRYRVEMITFEGGRQSNLQVIIGDRDRVYLYDQESADFIPAADLAEAEITGRLLEDYWRSISEASSFSYISEERGSRHHYYQVEIIPSEPHRYRVCERVWLEQGSFLPVRIESFDVAGRLTQVTVFELLQLNPLLEAALFQVEADPSVASGPEPPGK